MGRLDSGSNPDPNPNRKHFVLIVATLFIGYLAVALPLSILAIYTTRELGLSNFLGGLSVGASFLITILTRKFTGAEIDRLGGKVCFIRGALFYSVSGFFGMASALAALPAPARFALLILGRMSLGFGEGLLNNGAMHWSIGVMGTAKSGRVLATIGMCLYGTIAFGGLIGLGIYDGFGFATLMAACAILPLAAILMATRLPGPGGRTKDARKDAGESFLAMAKRIWRFGVAVCMQGVGNAIVGAFLVQVFLNRGWAHAGWGMFCFGSGYVLMRVVIGHLPDRVGGVPVAAASLLVEMAGLLTLWAATGPGSALTGAFLVGLGCSMIFPSLGREVLLTASADSRGTALGCYSAFQDLAMGAAGPIAGLLADHFGDKSVFLFGGIGAAAGAATLRALLGGGRAKGKTE